MRLLDAEDIENLAAGAALLGGGGGGDPYTSKLMARRALSIYGAPQLIDLAELADDDLVIGLAMIGAPTVAIERLFAEDAFYSAFQMLAQHIGRPARALMTLEIGGMNALVPLPTAARTGLPLVDIDGMGRALPELQMTSFSAHGLLAAPLVLTDDLGNRVLIEATDNYRAEKLARSAVIDLGGQSASALYPMSGAQLRASGIAGSVSRAIAIGRAFRATRGGAQHPIESIRQILGAALLFEGKVVDVRRLSDGGFARGQALVEGVGQHQGQRLAVQFQNEYLIAQIDQRVCASAPDLVGIFDLRSGDPIAVEQLRYGFQVAVLGVPAAPVWRTPAGLELIGPRAFGYPIDYSPCGGGDGN